MPRQRIMVARQVSLFVLGAIVLVPPVVTIFDRPIRFGGIPVLYLYLFVTWTALIGLMAGLASNIESEGDTIIRADDSEDETSKPGARADGASSDA